MDFVFSFYPRKLIRYKREWIHNFIKKIYNTCDRCMFVTINSFSRLSAPRSEAARGNERSNKVRTGFGVAWVRREEKHKDEVGISSNNNKLYNLSYIPAEINQEICKQHKTICLHSIQQPSSSHLTSLDYLLYKLILP